jgi:hypothetical protein
VTDFGGRSRIGVVLEQTVYSSIAVGSSSFTSQTPVRTTQ